MPHDRRNKIIINQDYECIDDCSNTITKFWGNKIKTDYLIRVTKLDIAITKVNQEQAITKRMAHISERYQSEMAIKSVWP